MNERDERSVVKKALLRFLESYTDRVSDRLAPHERMYVHVIIQAAKDFWYGRDITEEIVEAEAALGEDDAKTPEDRKKHASNANKLNTRRNHAKDALGWFLDDSEILFENLTFHIPGGELVRDRYDRVVKITCVDVFDAHGAAVDYKEVLPSGYINVKLKPGRYAVRCRYYTDGKLVSRRRFDCRITPLALSFRALCDILDLNHRLLRQLVQIQKRKDLEDLFGRYDRTDPGGNGKIAGSGDPADVGQPGPATGQ